MFKAKLRASLQKERKKKHAQPPVQVHGEVGKSALKNGLFLQDGKIGVHLHELRGSSERPAVFSIGNHEHAAWPDAFGNYIDAVGIERIQVADRSAGQNQSKRMVLADSIKKRKRGQPLEQKRHAPVKPAVA